MDSTATAPRFAHAASTIGSVLRSHIALALCLAALLISHFGGALGAIDNSLAAWRAGLIQRDATDSILVVEIDSRSVNAAGQWPWARERYARAIANLREAGASLIGFDVDFSARSDLRNDTALAQAIQIEPSSVVLPTFLQPGQLAENAPLASLSRDALVASVNLPIDADGRARRYVLGFQHEEHYHQSMAALLAGAPYGAVSRFKLDYGVRLDSIDRLSFHDVYRGTFDPAQVRGRTILIGATALELGDEFATPIRPAVPGVFIHALAYENIVQGRALAELAPWLSLLAALGALALLWPRQSATMDPRRWIALQVAALLGFVCVPLIAQALAPISLNFAGALLSQTLCFAVSIQRELKRRAEDLVRQREEHLRFSALHDPETQLQNRRAMIERLQREIAAPGENHVVAIAIGVDRFAMLRAAIGYGNANKIITRLAQRIIDYSGQSEVYHLSTSILGLVTVAQSETEMRQAHAGVSALLGAAIDLDGSEVDIGLRFGAALAADSANAEKLLENATVALDQARMRNLRFVFYDAAAFPDPKVQLALTSDIGRGIERGEFSLVYQPKARARDGVINGAEALIRWRHPEHGNIAPDKFIQVAEETGAIDDLTRWVLRQAIADQQTTIRGRLDAPISINISGRLLANANFCAAAIDAVQETNALLCFEITETAIIDDPGAALASIAALRVAGIKISIDDYGSGLSSLAYLKQIAADELKLDKSIIADIKTSARDRLILKSTIDLAHGLGMSVVAEGVEHEPARAVLASLGCDTIQGYLVSRPLALADFVALLSVPQTHLERTTAAPGTA